MKMHAMRLMLGALALALLGAPAAWAQQVKKVVPITIVVNQSPWFKGFAGVVDYYEQKTGNKVVLDVNPFMGSIEKQRASARAPQGKLDLFTTNARLIPEMYASGLVHSMDELDPTFKLDPNISDFDESACWDAKRKLFNCKTGKLMGVPINPNIMMFYYRADLYKEKGLTVPRTWDEFLKNCEKLQTAQMTCITQRGARLGINYDFFPYMQSFKGHIFKDQKNGDYTVTMNSKETLAGLKFYIDLAKKYGAPNTGALDQAEVVQMFSTGKTAHILSVIAAWDQLDDPDKSLVAGKFEVAVIPTNPPERPHTPIGHFISTIPKNVPMERKMAAVEFLKWFQTFDAQREYAVRGGVPVRSDVLRSDMSKEKRYRWMKPLADNFQYGDIWYNIPELGEVIAITELRWNQAITGELKPEDALNKGAEEVHTIMSRAGYKTGRLPNL